MPLPADEKLVALANDLVQQLQAMFGVHPGLRPAHAKGHLFTGTFTPAPEATALTRAPHVARASAAVTVRFSNGTGLPDIPDNLGDANPRGMAIRFHLAERVHTDIISHAVDGFPVRTGQEFLEFLRAAATSAPGTPSPTPIELFLDTHPAALRFVQTPKPSPVSFASQPYFGVTALRFVNAAGEVRHGRFRILPQAPVEHLDAAAAAAKGPNYLFDELKQRVASAPARFDIYVQLAGPGDIVDDATAHWPEDRPQVHFGTLALTGEADDNAAQQKYVIFDPIPRVDGIEPSDDPLLELRAAVYLLSGRARRSA